MRILNIVPVIALGAVGIAFALLSRNPETNPRVVSVAQSASGRWIAAGTADGRVTVWDEQNPAHRQQIHSDHGDLNDLQFSPDEQTLAVANDRLTLHTVENLGSYRVLRSDDRNYGAVRFTLDGQHLLTTTGPATMEILDVTTGKLQRSMCCSTIYGEVAFTPDGSLVASAGHWPALWDAQSGQLLARLTRDREFETFGPVAFDIRRGTILMGSQDGRVYAWDLQTRRLRYTSRAYPAYVNSICVPHGGPWIAFSGFGKQVRLWDPDTGEQRDLPSAITSSNLIAGSKDGSILFGTSSGSVEVWDTAAAARSIVYPDTR